MIDLPEGGYNLADMSEEEKDEAIKTLGMAYNEALSTGATLHNALTVLAGRLMQGDALGKRAVTMRDTAFRMTLIASMALPNLVGEDGIEQMHIDHQFEELTSDFDKDEE